jgi:hypothetical protein
MMNLNNLPDNQRKIVQATLLKFDKPIAMQLYELIIHAHNSPEYAEEISFRPKGLSITDLFTWSLTEQGHDFWHNIHKNTWRHL